MILFLFLLGNKDKYYIPSGCQNSSRIDIFIYLELCNNSGGNMTVCQLLWARMPNPVTFSCVRKPVHHMETHDTPGVGCAKDG